MITGKPMNPILKKITAALLLASLMAPLSYSYIFQLKQASIQSRMKKQLQEKMLHSLVLVKKDLHWVKPGKEIIVGERMFDIKTIEYRDDGTVFITGLFDNEETFLYALLKKNRKEETNRNHHQIIQLFQLMQSLPDPPYEQELTPGAQGNPYSLFTANLFPSPFSAILTPPPQC